MIGEHELRRRRDDLRDQLAAFDRLWRGKPMSDEARAEWVSLQLAWREADRAVAEDRRMRLRLLEMAKNPASGIRGNEPEPLRIDQPADLRERQRDALRAVERAEREGVLTERAAVNLDGLIRRDEQGAEARYLAATFDPAYKSAYLRIMAGAISGGWGGQEMASAGLSESERSAIREVQEAMTERALAVGAGGTGGFAVPADLDPSVIMSSDGRVNPFRQILPRRDRPSNEWRGVTSLGVSASFQAEAEEVGDDAPALLQPTAFPERAAAFVPFSIEIGQDWGALAAELARMFADAKDELEVTEFTTGLGHAANKPEGLYTGATAIVSTTAATHARHWRCVCAQGGAAAAVHAERAGGR